MASQILTNAGYSLYPHQKKGIDFLVNIENNHNKGGILADEVGLGKTIQTIALLLERPGHTLIAGPLAVVPQWAETQEDKQNIILDKFCDKLSSIF